MHITIKKLNVARFMVHNNYSNSNNNHKKNKILIGRIETLNNNKIFRGLRSIT